MKNRKNKLLDAFSDVVDISDMCFDTDLVLFETSSSADEILELPAPVDTLIETEEEIVKSKPIPRKQISEFRINPLASTRRASDNIESRINSALAELIEQKTKTKALPLTLRKQLMYQQAVASGH